MHGRQKVKSYTFALKINKTDKNDARGIAEALRAGMHTRVHCKPEESINRAILLTARRALIEQQTHLKNTVRGLLKGYGIRLGSISAKKFGVAVMKQTEEIAKDDKKLALRSRNRHCLACFLSEGIVGRRTEM